MPESLLAIQSEAVSVWIEGPRRPIRYLHEPGAIQGKLSLHLTGDNDLSTCVWLDQEGRLHEGTGRGPMFFEETPYKLTVKANREGEAVAVFHRDPSLLDSVTTIAGEPGWVSGSINFRSQIGRSLFRVSTSSGGIWFEIEVFPTKLDYMSDYRALLADVSTVARALVLEYLRATYQEAALVEEDEPTALEWITLLRAERSELEKALSFISSNPQRSLMKDTELTRVERIRQPSSLTLRAITRRQGEGEWISIPGIGSLRARLPSGRSAETLDTPEHRWLKSQLALALHRLSVIRAQLLSELNSARSGSRRTRIRQELEEIVQAEETLSHHLQRDPLTSASGEIRADFASLALLWTPGYREAYRSLLRLRMALRVNGGAVETAVKDLSELYEYWCFLRTVAIVAETVGGEINPPELFHIDDAGIRVRLKKGAHSRISLNDSSRRIELSYNRTYPGLTGDQRPDVVIEFVHPGWPPLVLILDAKYRVEASEGYVSAFGAPGPPRDAINQLHRYRDAIAQFVEGYGFGRPVVRGAALFPGTEELVEQFRGSSLHESLDSLGIGALPLLPQQDTLFREWIDRVLSQSAEELSWPGPPFLGWEHRDPQRHFRESQG